MAEIAERLPEGADEVVLGRRVSAQAGGPAPSSPAAPPRPSDLKAAGRAAARLLRPARAPQADDLLGPDGRARRLRRRRAAGAARALPRGAPRVPAARRRAGRAARARRLARARSRPLSLRALRDRGGGAGSRRRSGSWAASASACATPRACARRRPARTRSRSAPRRTAAAPPRRWPRPRRCCRAWRESTPSLDALAERASAPWRSSSATSPPSCATTSTGSRPTRAACAAIEERLEAIDRLQRKHGGSVESVLAHAERCRAEIARLESAGERGEEAEAALAEAEARRAKLGEKLGKARAKAAAPLQREVAAELERLAMAGRPARGRARAAPGRLRRQRHARRSSSAWRRTRASSPRRCATPPRAASSRG